MIIDETWEALISVYGSFITNGKGLTLSKTEKFQTKDWLEDLMSYVHIPLIQILQACVEMSFCLRAGYTQLEYGVINALLLETCIVGSNQ